MDEKTQQPKRQPKKKRKCEKEDIIEDRRPNKPKE